MPAESLTGLFPEGERNGEEWAKGVKEILFHAHDLLQKELHTLPVCFVRKCWFTESVLGECTDNTPHKACQFKSTNGTSGKGQDLKMKKGRGA